MRVAEEIERQLDGSMRLGTMNRHFDLAAIQALCDRLQVWESLSQLLGGEGLVLWRSNVFRGNPALPWHEDGYAKLLASTDADADADADKSVSTNISVLVALTDNVYKNCMLYAPGSHKLSVSEKERRYGIAAERKPGGNVRYRGVLQPEDYVHLLPRAGECVIFHSALLHASRGLAGCAEAGRRTNVVFRLTTPAMQVAPAAYAPSEVEGGPVLIYGGAGAYRTPRRASERR